MEKIKNQKMMPIHKSQGKIDGESSLVAPIKAVIFDMGGVILRTMDQTPRQRLAERLGVSLHDLYHQVFSSESARLATLGKITARQHWEQVGAHFNLSPQELPKAIQQFWDGDRLDNGLIAFIRSLRRHRKSALLSNAWDDLHGFIENEWKIADAFDELVISAEIGLAKPDHRIFQVALDRLGVDASQTLFVDDFGENVDGARWLGMHAIQFRSTGQAISEIRRFLDQAQPASDRS
jgi:epoxide hydrolase-like predicted phosphatase